MLLLHYLSFKFNIYASARLQPLFEVHHANKNEKGLYKYFKIM